MNDSIVSPSFLSPDVISWAHALAGVHEQCLLLGLWSAPRPTPSCSACTLHSSWACLPLFPSSKCPFLRFAQKGFLALHLLPSPLCRSQSPGPRGASQAAGRTQPPFPTGGVLPCLCWAPGALDVRIAPPCTGHSDPEIWIFAFWSSVWWDLIPYFSWEQEVVHLVILYFVSIQFNCITKA